MGSGFVEARYEWNWSSLVGSVQGVLRAYALPHDAAWVSATLGDAFRVGARGAMEPSDDGETAAFTRTGFQPRRLDSLTSGLAVLGLKAEVATRDLRQQGPPRFLRRRIRQRIDRGEAVVAYGVGAVPSARTEFGLIVGYDDGREAYRIDGPLTEATGVWMSYEAWPGGRSEASEPGTRWFAVLFARGGRAAPQAAPALARGQALASEGAADLERWIAILEGGVAVHPQGHAFWMQALGAARFEASRFWSTVAAEDARLVSVAEAYRREALLLSRLATLYPYPAGGDVGNPNLRRLAGGMLRQATDVEREAVARLRAVELEPPDGSGG